MPVWSDPHAHGRPSAQVFFAQVAGTCPAAVAAPPRPASPPALAPPSPPPSPGEGSSVNAGLSVRYGVWSRAAGGIPATCPYELANLGQSVPSECCSTAPTVQEPLVWDGSNCKSFPALGAFIRDYLGCDGGVVTFGEVCTPPGESAARPRRERSAEQLSQPRMPARCALDAAQAPRLAPGSSTHAAPRMHIRCTSACTSACSSACTPMRRYLLWQRVPRSGVRPECELC